MVMSHKTIVNGTAYEVVSGKCLVGGASYGINNGKALVGGTCYNVTFGSNELILFENGIVQNCEFTADLSGLVISSNQTTGADVAYIDSKTNLLNVGIDVINYNGATITNLSARHPSLAQTVRTFIASAGQSLPACERTSVFDIPLNASAHYAHIMTRKGVYKTVIDPFALDSSENGKMKAFLLHLYQNVMNEIKNAQAKDQAARNSN